MFLQSMMFNSRPQSQQHNHQQQNQRHHQHHHQQQQQQYVNLRNHLPVNIIPPSMLPDNGNDSSRPPSQMSSSVRSPSVPQYWHQQQFNMPPAPAATPVPNFMTTQQQQGAPSSLSNVNPLLSGVLHHTEPPPDYNITTLPPASR